jgi:hypothetical protein
MNKEYMFLIRRIGHSDINGVSYYNSVKKEIKNSKLKSSQKKYLFKLLDNTSGIFD